MFFLFAGRRVCSTGQGGKVALLCLVGSNFAESAGPINGLFSPSEQSRCEQINVETPLYNQT